VKSILLIVLAVIIFLSGCESNSNFVVPKFHEGEKVIIIVNGKEAFIHTIDPHYRYVNYGIQYSDDLGKLQYAFVGKFEIKKEEK